MRHSFKGERSKGQRFEEEELKRHATLDCDRSSLNSSFRTAEKLLSQLSHLDSRSDLSCS